MKRIPSPALNLLIISIFALSPSLRASVPGDEHWDSQFGPAGANAPLAGVAVIGKNVFVAGTSLTAAGNTKANGVAGFDGTNWFQLNRGLLNLAAVLSVQVDSNYLYASGIFTNADDPTAINTARWDGTNWSGIGITGLIACVRRNGTNVYFAGAFSMAGGVAATNIARWDGSNWFPLGSGVSGCSGSFCSSGINSVAFQNNNVYVGGNFTSAGGVSASFVAYYDGANWSAMGNPFNNAVVSLAFYGPYLYAAGNFTNSGLAITNIARWNGASWSAIPGGNPNGSVNDLTLGTTNLFISGSFTRIGGISATGVVSFDGSNWSALGNGLHGFQGNTGQGNKMFWLSNQLYVAGTFERAGDVGACNVARWDGTNWWSLGGATSKGMTPSLNFVNDLLVITNSLFVTPGLYAAGTFVEAGDVVVNGIGRWDGTNWHPVGSGFSGGFGTSSTTVHSMTANNAYLYVAGSFTNAGGNAALGVAYWDGANWNSLGSGVDSVVNEIEIDNANIVYVAGIFTNSDAGYSRGFAAWNTGNWYNLGTLEGTNGAGNAVVFDGTSKIYVGGSFFSAGGVSASNIAYLDNSDFFSWHPLGLGFNAKVNALAYGNGILYAGGSFTKAGALTVNRIAQWDGANWSAMGTGISGGSSALVNEIKVVGTNVYVTGNFTNAGGVFATNIAVWNGSSWSALGSGLEIPRAGFALATKDNDLYVGGNFGFAGDKPAEFIARWNGQTNFYPPANMRLTRLAWQTNGQFRFRVTGTSGQSYILQGSSNLTSWTPLFTNCIMFYDFSDTNSSAYRSRFYRALLGP